MPRVTLFSDGPAICASCANACATSAHFHAPVLRRAARSAGCRCSTPARHVAADLVLVRARHHQVRRRRPAAAGDGGRLLHGDERFHLHARELQVAGVLLPALRRLAHDLERLRRLRVQLALRGAILLGRARRVFRQLTSSLARRPRRIGGSSGSSGGWRSVRPRTAVAVARRRRACEDAAHAPRAGTRSCPADDRADPVQATQRAECARRPGMLHRPVHGPANHLTAAFAAAAPSVRRSPRCSGEIVSPMSPAAAALARSAIRSHASPKSSRALMLSSLMTSPSS